MSGTVLPAIPPIGLLTSPNRAGGMPAGALALARGVYLREPGVLTGQPTWTSLSSGFISISSVSLTGINTPGLDTAGLVIFYLSSGDSWFFSSPTSTAFISYFMTGQSGFAAERLWIDEDPWPSVFRWFAGSARSNSRLVVPTGYSTTILEANPANFDATPLSRVAGLAQPLVFNVSLAAPLGSSPTDGVLSAGNRSLYTCVLRRTYDDGTELVSFPSAPVEAWILVGSLAGNMAVSLVMPSTARAGDYVDVYRTKQKSWTPSQEELGSDFYLVTSEAVTLADLSIGYKLIGDGTPDAGLGKALYTNPGVRGAAAANAMPPSCKAIESFKGYVFYGNVAELPSLTFSVGGFWGTVRRVAGGAATSQQRANAIGLREVSGNITSGSSTITGVPTLETVGIVPGQIAQGPFTSANAKVVSVTSTTVTFDKLFTVTTAFVIPVFDVFEVNGFECFVTTVSDVVNALITKRDLFGFSCFAMNTQQAINGSGQRNELAPTDGVTIFYRYRINNAMSRADMTIRATNGHNYTPKLPEITDPPLVIPHRQRENMLRFSEENNAEACPIANYAFVGHGTIYTLKATRDALFIFASDGLWRLSGTGGSAGAGFDWRVDPVDTTLRLTNSTCVVSLADSLYALTNRGLVRIDSSGTVTELSSSRIDDQFTNSPWDPYTRAWVASDEDHREISFQPVPNTGDDDQVFIYNIDTNAFTTLNTGSASSETSNDYFHAFWSSQYGTVYLRELTQEYYAKETDVHAGSLVLYQSLSGSNTFSIKQFNDVSLLFDADDDGLVLSVMANPKPGYPLGDSFRWTSGYLVAHRHDGSISRAASGISRNAPSAANSIMLGYTVAPGAPNLHRFHGMGVSVVTTAVRRMLRQ